MVNGTIRFSLNVQLNCGQFLNPYNPAQIFDDGHDFAIAQPQEARRGLLRSLGFMISRELVSSDQRPGLVEAACAVWAVKPDEAIHTFNDGFNELIPGQAANLVNPINWEDEEQIDLLIGAWSSIAPSQDSDDRVTTTKYILEKGLLGPEDEPDYALRLWLDANEKNLNEILTASITLPDL